MSDFLGNLAMRSLGLAPLVQPRPLTAFEALPAEGALAARAAERPAEPMELETESTAWPRPAALSPDQPAALTPAPLEVGARRASRAPELETQPAPVPASQSAALTPAPNDGARDEGERHAVVAQQASRMPQPAARQASQATMETQAVASLQAPALPARPVAAPASEDETEAPYRRRALTPAVEEIKAGPIQGKPIAPQAESLAERAEWAPAAPTINVTIGRVEVRAAVSPRLSPEPRTERRRAPSLDDYLRARSGGKP